ncbi:hypothetical protein [Modestobacter sp. SSW1-42]|uniref:hypothetical protein n=1 Tax=Modestobacter sp. SSW1-42 TaxID=596372 RepID=UPI003985EA7D
MNRWEYRHTSASSPLPELNALGADGWEVVAPIELVEQTETSRTEEHVLLLRRPIHPAAATVTGD